MRFKYEDLSNSPLVIDSIYEGGTKKNPYSDDPLTKLFRIEGFKRSVGNESGFRKSLKEKSGKSINDYAYVVIKSTGKIDEWPDYYDKNSGTFIYFGDNREPGNDDYLKTKQLGNVLLESIFKKTYGSIESRKTIPPIFVFKSTGFKSNVEFLGIAVPGVKGKSINEVLELKTFGEYPNQFKNYKAHFTMLKIESEGVSRKWLAQLKDANGDTEKYAPKEWVNFLENGLENIIPQKVDQFTTNDNVSNKIFPSEKEYLRKVRTTQGKFRENLLKVSPSCKICGMDVTDLLVASHIKPWRDSNDVERIDFYNGLLLCPAHNASFDSGYITFDKQGSIIISEFLKNQNIDLLSLNDDIQIELEPNHLKYMEWHNNYVFRHK